MNNKMIIFIIMINLTCLLKICFKKKILLKNIIKKYLFFLKIRFFILHAFLGLTGFPLLILDSL